MGRISRVSLIVGLILFPALVFAKFHKNTTSPYSLNGLGDIKCLNALKEPAMEILSIANIYLFHINISNEVFYTSAGSVTFLFEFETIDRNLVNNLYQFIPKTFFLDTTAPVLTDLNKFAFNEGWMTDLFSIQNDINRIIYREGSKYGETHLYIKNQRIKNPGISFGNALSGYWTNSILKNARRGTKENNLVVENYVKNKPKYEFG